MKNLPTGQAGDNIKSKLWETAYAASALSGKTWNQIMQKFEKPQPTPLNQNKETLAPQKIEEKLQKQNITRKLNLKKTSVATVIKAISEQKTTEAPQPIKKVGLEIFWKKFLIFSKLYNFSCFYFHLICFSKIFKNNLRCNIIVFYFI